MSTFRSTRNLPSRPFQLAFAVCCAVLCTCSYNAPTGVGAPSLLAFSVQPSGVVAGAAIVPAVRVVVEDARGNTVTTATPSITVAIGNDPSRATLSGTVTEGAVGGIATFPGLSLDKADTGYTLIASGPGLLSATSTAFSVTPGPPAKLAFTVQPGSGVAGVAMTPAVQVAVEDAQGNIVTGATLPVTLVIGSNPASGTLSGSTTTTAVNGIATFATLSINAAGVGYTLIASSSGLTGATSVSFAIGVGSPSKLVFSTQPMNAAAGTAIAPAVQVAVEDNQGNTVTTATPSVTVDIGSNPSSGVLSGITTVSAVSGVATFPTLSLNRAGVGYTLTASSTGLTAAASAPFSISAGAATKLVFTVQPTSTVAGTAITPGVQVAVEDSLGNTATTATPSITVAIGSNPAGGILSGTTSVVAASGVATFSALKINAAGVAYTLTASAAGLTVGTSAAFNVTPGSPAKLVFLVGPNSAAVGAAIAPAVRVAVEDSLGNAVTSASTPITVALAANPGNGTLSGATTIPAVSGIATFSGLSVDSLGIGYTLGASATGLTGATSSSFNITTTTVGLLSAGEDFACAVTKSGVAYCWGDNANGGLGNGDSTSSATPVAVSGGLSFQSVSAAPAGGNSCGVTGAGVAYCWGTGVFGELGNGDTTDISTPAAVLGGFSFTTVSTGGGPTCGLIAGGAAYCWGLNNVGQLGVGSTTGPQQCPQSEPCSTTPVAVVNGLSFKSVSSGGATTCAVTVGGAGYCWGYNGFGQLGDGDTARSAAPVPVSGGLSFKAISSSGSFTTCGLTTSGAAYCWGIIPSNSAPSGTNARTTPVPVSGGFSFTTVAAGHGYACGLTVSGAAYCWGYNGNGQLGNGSTSDSATPVAVSGGLSFTAVSAGSDYACGLTAGGAAYCWGNNSQGQLGNGSTTGSTTPVPVSGGLTFPTR